MSNITHIGPANPWGIPVEAVIPAPVRIGPFIGLLAKRTPFAFLLALRTHICVQLVLCFALGGYYPRLIANTAWLFLQ
jgi:hypothetical protein